MPNLLHIDSSADVDTSTSRALTERFANEWVGLGDDFAVTHRDLHTDPLPYLPTNEMHWAPRFRSPHAVVDPASDALQQVLIDELLESDVVVIGAPMYNWSIPATLKTWIDYIHVPGTTTTYDEPFRPLEGKPVVVVSSRGDQYGPGTPEGLIDHQSPALTQVLGGALAMDLRVVPAELTLAMRIPSMAGYRAKARQNEVDARRLISDQVADIASRFLSAPRAS